MKPETTLSLVSAIVALTTLVVSAWQVDRAYRQADREQEVLRSQFDAAQQQALAAKVAEGASGSESTAVPVDTPKNEQRIAGLLTILREVGPTYYQNSARVRGAGNGNDDVLTPIQERVVKAAAAVFGRYSELCALSEQGQLPPQFLAKAESFRMDVLRDEKVLKLLNEVIFGCRALERYADEVAQVRRACGESTMRVLLARMERTDFCDRPVANFDVTELGASLSGR